MNDRFKFRAWNKAEKRFMTDINIFGAGGNNHILEIEEYDKGNCTMYNVDEVQLQQCTGLKDKNGKLIYEGDICEYEFEDIGKQKAIIYFNNKYASFLKKPLNDFQYAEINDCKVIGNIYQNKELLEEECQK